SNAVNAMAFDGDDRGWCATDVGLYRGAPGPRHTFTFQPIVPHAPNGESMTAFSDSRGRLWFGMAAGLIEVADGQIIRYNRSDQVGRYRISAIVQDRRGRLLVANLHEVFEFREPPLTGQGQWRQVPLNVAPGQAITAMVVDATGALWVGGSAGP